MKAIFFDTIFEEDHKFDEKVKSLDPIKFDQHLLAVRTMNEKRDITSLLNLTYSVLPFPETIDKFSKEEAIACMRDLGILLGSIKRHGKEPVEEIPELEYVLNELSIKTDLPARDTLSHYTIWNPSDERKRKYTHHEGEDGLIESVRMSMPSIIRAIYYLIELNTCAVDDPYFEYLCEKTQIYFNGMVKGVVHARRSIPPELFANELRFYFDPIKIFGKELIGPGAVEMPLFVYDHLLWSSDVIDPEYREFKSAYLAFNKSNIRDIYFNYDKKESIVTKTCMFIEENGLNHERLNSLKALYSLCNAMKSFRMPHLKMAKESYAHQKKDGRQKGSGGYSTSILGHIIDLNNVQINRILKAMGKKEKVI